MAFPPLIMGAVYQARGSYMIGLPLLALTAALVGLFARRAFRSSPQPA